MSPELIVGGPQPRTKEEIEKSKQRPAVPLVHFFNIPEQLRDRRRWVLWRPTWRMDKNGNGRWTKLPFHQEYHGKRTLWPNVKANDPSTWMDYEDVAHICAILEDRGRYGIGYELGVVGDDSPESDIVVIDLDDCRDRFTGEITPAAQEIIATFDSYTELSPSGTGVHIFLRGQKPPGGTKHDSGVEIYGRGKFLAMTGQLVLGVSADIEDRQAELNELCQRLFPPPRAVIEYAADGRPRLPAGRGPLPSIPYDRVIERARRYLSCIPEAVSGRHGSRRTIHAACILVVDFGLSMSDALPLLEEYNARCSPPWERDELLRRLNWADGRPGPRGHMLISDTPSRDWLTEIAELEGATIRSVRRTPDAEPEIVIDLSDFDRPTAPASDAEPPAVVPTPPPLSPLTETEAAGLFSAARRDFNRYPCCCPTTISLRQRKHRTKHLVKRRCEKWYDRDGCLSYLIDREMINARHRVWAAVDAGKKIYVGWCWPEQWNVRLATVRRMDRKLKRGATDYIKCLDSGEGGRPGFLVISTEPFPAGIASKPEDALDMLQAALNAFDGDRRPVSTSHGWKLPEYEASEEYERDGGPVVNDDPAFIRQAARAAGFVADIRIPHGSGLWPILMWVTFRHLSGGEAPQEDADYLDALLAVGEMFPRSMLDAIMRRVRPDGGGDGGGGGCENEEDYEDPGSSWVDL